MLKDPEPDLDPHLVLMDPDPDPGGPKTYESYGSVNLTVASRKTKWQRMKAKPLVIYCPK